MYRRIVSLLLALALCASMLPTAALAEALEPEEETVPQETVQEETQEPTEETQETTEETEAPTVTTEATEAQTEPTQEETEATEETAPAEEAAAEEAMEALGEEEVFSGWEEVEIDWEDMDLTQEEAFAGYAEGVFYGTDYMPYGTTAGSYLTGNEKIAYDAVVPGIKEIAKGERADTTFVITGCTNSELDSDLLLRALRADLAFDLYWADIYQHRAGEGTMACAWSWMVNKTTQEKYDYQLTIRFSVAADYRDTTVPAVIVTYSGGGQANYYCTADLAKTGAAARATTVAEGVVNDYARLGDYQKLKAYADWIADNVDYNYDAIKTNNVVWDHIDPWQLIYVFDEDPDTKVVCEGYSKAFMYLCDLSTFQDEDLVCYTVWGTMDNGDHMWDNVHFKGKNYLVDVTNYDMANTTARRECLFMGGAKPDSSGNYSFKYNSQTIKYKYDALLSTIFTKEELTLAETSYDPGHIHKWTTKPVIKAATCTEAGSEDQECSCGEKRTVDIPALGHQETQVNAQAATCTQPGREPDIYCTRCKETLTVGKAIDALGHDWEVTAKKEPTCTEAGAEEKQTCKREGCGAVEGGEVIAALGHNFLTVDKKEATCTEKGYTGDQVCQREECGEKVPGEDIPAQGHDWEVTLEPTCEVTGSKYCQRPDCTVNEANPEEIPALGHELKLVDQKDATCTEEGYSGDEVCQREACGETVEQGKVIAPLGHNSELGKIDAQEATDDETGWTVYADYVCSRCSVRVDEGGKELTEEEIAAHNFEHVVYAAGKTVSITLAGEEVPTVVDRTEYTEGMNLSAAVSPVSAKQDVTWKSSAPAVISVDENGHLEFLKNGKATITATTEDKRVGKVTIQVTTLAQGITVTSKNGSDEVGAGKSLALVATVAPAETVIKKVTWSITEGNDYARVSTSGVVTAAKTVPDEGATVTVKAAAVDGSKKEGTFQVKVLPLVASVTIADQGERGKLDMSEATTVSLTPKILPEDASDKVVWSSNNQKIATVSEDGKVTAIKPGNVTIIAKAADGSNRSAQYKLAITASVTGLTLSGGEQLGLGKSMKLTPEFSPAYATNRTVVWSVDNSNVASISNGTLKAKKAGTVTVTATVKGTNIEATKTVTVQAPATQVILQQDETTVTGKTLGASVGDTVALGAKILPADDTIRTVTWTSSNQKVAQVGINEDGKAEVTAVAPGKATITATATDGSGKKAAVTVTVVQKMESLTISGANVIAGGKNLTLKPVITPANTTNKKLTWQISENTVGATVSNGLLKTKAVTGATTVTVTATAQDGSDTTARWEVTIYPITTSVEIQKNDVKVTALTLGTKVKGALENSVTLAAVPKAAKDATPCKEVKWTSSNEKVAKVADGTVTAVAPGRATITAAAMDGSGRKASVTVTVVQPVEKVVLPETAAIAGGKSLTLKATIAPANATIKKLTWTVALADTETDIDIKNVATISNGVLKTKGVKTPTDVIVTAEAQDGSGAAGSCRVTIYPAATKVTLTQGDGTALIGTQTLKVNRVLSLKAAVDPEEGAYQKVTWSTSSAKVAVVNENGVVIPVARGTVTITATAADGSGRKATVKITIVP